MKTCDDCFEIAKYWKRNTGRTYLCNRTGSMVDPSRAACVLFVLRDDVPDPDPVHANFTCPVPARPLHE